jgi:hypothetical protein
VIPWELEKAISNSSDKPKFIVAFMLTISIKPSNVKCLLHLTNWKAALNNWKSDHLCVIKGKLLKWSTMICKSFIDETLYLTASLPCEEILPIPIKNTLIDSNKHRSFM